jgi:hypothetical protein
VDAASEQMAWSGIFRALERNHSFSLALEAIAWTSPELMVHQRRWATS